MKSKLSALLDGEAEVGEVPVVCEALRRQPGLRQDAATYALIGACLRGEPRISSDVTPKVMDALANEPVVLAPRRFSGVQAGWMALAASVAGAVVLAVVLLVPVRDVPQGSAFALADMPVGAKVRVLARGSTSEPKLNEADIRQYLIAHEAHSYGSYVGASSQQIRTVSMLDESAK